MLLQSWRRSRSGGVWYQVNVRCLDECVNASAFPQRHFFRALFREQSHEGKGGQSIVLLLINTIP